MLLRIAAAFLATVTFAVIFNAPKKELCLCGLAGTSGWLVYELSQGITPSLVVPVFFATVMITAISRILSFNRKNPITVYLISGIIPFVPGAGIYYTMYYILENDTAQAVFYGLNALKTAGAISLGIMSVFSLPQKLFRLLSLKKI